jgi:hypothetical protein
VVLPVPLPLPVPPPAPLDPPVRPLFEPAPVVFSWVAQQPSTQATALSQSPTTTQCVQPPLDPLLPPVLFALPELRQPVKPIAKSKAIAARFTSASQARLRANLAPEWRARRPIVRSNGW